MKTINIGLMGLGTVGSGVYQLLSRNNEVLKKRLRADLRVKKILVQDLSKPRDPGIDRSLITENPDDLISDKEIDIMVELIGGTTVAKDLVARALTAKKSVVTANKELMANHGRRMLELAEENNVDLLFEASVAGGIPIIGPLKNSLIGNEIKQIMGIVNGTTNYILTKMGEGRDFDEVLAEAQELGYAESDPSADIDGIDAGAKIAILGSIAFNNRVTADQVYIEGISRVTAKDIMYARELGYAIKLVALAKKIGDTLDVRVHPTMIPLEHPLAKVNDVYNAIFVVGDAVGELMFFGQGAGSLPTASAVVGDVFEAATNRKFGSDGSLQCSCFWDMPINSIEEAKSNFYILMEVADRPGVLAKIASVFGDEQVSIGSVIQKQSSGHLAELVFMTHLVREGNLRQALEGIKKLDVVDKICNVVRVETEGNV